MANFDVSFLNPKFRKSAGAQDYGFLVDQLQIMENRLKADGKLSPGDYKALNDKAMEIYSHPGLTPAQRSNVEVKMSGYQSSSNTTSLRDSQDVSRLNRDVQNDGKKVSMAFGNDPQIFLKGKTALLEGKLFRLQEAADQQDAAGDDSTQTRQELLKTQDEWLDTKAALDVAANYKPGTPPQGDFVAYIETNSKGEIRDIDISRANSKSGYLQTNGVLGGFPILGKAQTKLVNKEGKNVFKLGDTTFSAPSIQRPGPDGSLKSDVLVAESQQTPFGSRGKTKAVGDFLEVATSTVKTQRYTRPGEWIQSGDSFYKHLDNGQYERYRGATQADLGIADEDIMKNLPDEMLSTIKGKTVRTIDNTPAFTPTVPATGVAPAASGPAIQGQIVKQAPEQTTLGAGRARTGGPTESSPDNAPSLASKVFGAAGNYLKGLFSANPQ